MPFNGRMAMYERISIIADIIDGNSFDSAIRVARSRVFVFITVTSFTVKDPPKANRLVRPFVI